ncbi:MAG: hypothetical protein AAB796_01500 [Patescibacteria group bacterium]
MNTADATQSSAPSLLDISGYDFLLKLIDREDILECSPEYGPFSKYNWSNSTTIRFVLKEERIGFTGAGSLTFVREECSWMVMKSIEFKLCRVSSTPLLTEKDWSRHAILTIDWFANTLHKSGVYFRLGDNDITSPAVEYGLKILERAKKVLKRKK